MVGFRSATQADAAAKKEATLQAQLTAVRTAPLATQILGNADFFVGATFTLQVKAELTAVRQAMTKQLTRVSHRKTDSDAALLAKQAEFTQAQANAAVVRGVVMIA